MIRTYSELSQFETFDDRLGYLQLLDGMSYDVGRDIKQSFYKSPEWFSARDETIVRDYGCDLGIPGYEIHQNILIHHINVMTVDDILDGAEWIIDPEYLITTTLQTHNAIHHGDRSLVPKVVTERTPNDTKLW